ncbi:MAG: hypothetical protein UT84_C0001G0058 [Candidatus Curtissbacteria bacterium GW2011_GWA1_40_16]|uniref:Uncharacterized protein n=1 Tax=Candidatus Curtissbacteria bacterium GW2011_GWA1_40_16 TaxID=1618405 RepID=A0A0G0RFY1_9BACT|nr:MAG: hypothetical protein UT84_C0001G0058 [Candidatus Curtissbacteria bacterium GW2011_GWA1_40_16]
MDPQNSQNQQQGARQTIPLRSVPPKNMLSKFLPVLVVVILVAAGIFSGLVFSSRAKSASQAASSALKDDKNLPAEVQKSFNQTFKDEAEGTIEENDQLDKYAQGTHKLIRPGGESQTAYLTSSVLDLGQYVGKKVKVFGETFGSSQVGWLMDVGKVEVIQ